MRIVITGVSGFVGRHLAAFATKAGAEVVGFGRRSGEELRRLRLAGFLTVDLMDPTAVASAIRTTQPERIFHLAAEASVPLSWRHPRRTLDNNLETSLHVLEAARTEAPSARLLVSCSGEAYGPVPAQRLPVTESEPLRPQNPYAVSKAAVDLLAGFYGDAHGLAVVRTRAFNHCGPGQSEHYVVASFARQIAAAEAEGRPAVSLTTGDLRPRRDFADVRDVVRAYWLALDGGDPGIYNVCSGASTAIADILAGLASHSRLEVDHMSNERLFREHDVMEIRGSHTKLTEATGWRPEIPLDRTLRDTLDWWRKRIRHGDGK